MFGTRTAAIKAGEDLAKIIVERNKKKKLYDDETISGNLVSSAPRRLRIRRRPGRRQPRAASTSPPRSWNPHHSYPRRATSDLSVESESAVSTLTMDSEILPPTPPAAVAVAENNNKNGVETTKDDSSFGLAISKDYPGLRENEERNCNTKKARTEGKTDDYMFTADDGLTV